MIRSTIVLLAVAIIAGCATATPVDISANSTQLETRQIQSRQYDTLDKALTRFKLVLRLNVHHL